MPTLLGSDDIFEKRDAKRSSKRGEELIGIGMAMTISV
jgi:hypothetical protein